MIIGGLAERFALLATGIFFGAALYVTTVEHPARIEAGTDAALRQFRPSARRAARLQGSAAVIGSLSSLAAWLLGSSSSWAFAAAILFLAIPITFLSIFPINKQLLDPNLQPTDEAVSRLLTEWGRLHSARTIVGLLAFTIQIGASKGGQ